MASVSCVIMPDMISKKFIYKFLILICVSLFCSCTSKAEKNQNKKERLMRKSALEIHSYAQNVKNQKEERFDRFVKILPLKWKISQLFMENLEGNQTFRTYENYSVMTGNKEDENEPLLAGGYLFFSYNLADSLEETKFYISTLRWLSFKCNGLQPLLAIDQEGGYVNRLKKLTGGLPAQQMVSETLSVSEAYELYADQAVKMREIGFDMNLAPVIEVCTTDNQDFLNGRSFGDIEKVKSYGLACVNAYENNGIGAVIKHFPGNTNTDPHTGLPEISLNKDEFYALLEPFKYVTFHEPAGIIMSHARVLSEPQDSGIPACLSYFWVTKILRREYGYNGIIFSDDIFMAALAENGYPPETACIMAIEAGVDCIMLSEKRFGKTAAVLYKKALSDSEFEEKINEAAKRVLLYKLKCGLITENLVDHCLEVYGR